MDEHHVHVYTSKSNDGTIVKAGRPADLFRNSIAKIFMETDNGTRASVMLYSIVETAKANGLKTYQYLELLLTELSKHAEDKNLSFLDNLMPWSSRVPKECPVNFKKS